MTLKQNFLITFGMAATLLVAGCSQEKFPDMPDDGGARPLRITVTDGGYASDGASKNDTRAVENGYTTEFTAGDVCGLYMVRSGSVVYENVKLTATAGTNGTLTWQPEKGRTLTGGYSNETYFLYYPYQPDMTGKINASSTSNDADFFAPLISGWQPAADQSTYAKYTACDLMTAKGSAIKNTAGGKLLLTFSLTHRMALAVIDVPKTVYHFTNTDVSISDYVVDPVDFSSSEVKPWRCGTDGTYRCIVKPAGSTTVNIIGVYDEGNKEFMAVPPNIAAGNYKRYVVDEATVTTIEHLLQVGDYYLEDGHLLSKAATLTNEEKKKVIGIVFYAGHHSDDDSGYYYSGIALTKCHGYVVASRDATDDKCMWGALQSSYSGKREWNGYRLTQSIITCAGGMNNLNGAALAGYPATYYAAVAYEESNKAPANSSGWFLPAAMQLSTINNNYYVLFVNKKAEITPLAESVYYWSSSEAQSDRVRVYTTSSANGATKSKTSVAKVRSVLAF